MSKTLALLVQESNQIIENIIENGGEISPELERELLEINTAIPAKIDSYAYLLEKLKVEKVFWYAKAEELENIASRCGKLETQLKDRLKAAVIELGVKELKGNDKVIQVSASKKSLDWDDNFKFDEKYYKTVTERFLDIEKIQADLDAGIEIVGIDQKPNYRLSVKVNKEKK